jgi:hypothetical protein
LYHISYIISYHIIYHIIPYIIPYIISYHIISCHVMSCYVMSYISYHIYLYPISGPSWLVIVWITYLLTYLLTPWSNVLLEKLTGSQSRNSPAFYEPEGSLPYSQVRATCPYPEHNVDSTFALPLPVLESGCIVRDLRWFSLFSLNNVRVVYKAFVLHTRWILGSNLVPKSR